MKVLPEKFIHRREKVHFYADTVENFCLIKLMKEA